MSFDPSARPPANPRTLGPWTTPSLWAAVLLLSVMTPTGFAQTLSNPQALQSLELTSGRFQDLAIDEYPDRATIFTTVEVDATTTWTLELVRHSIRTDGFRLLLDDRSGRLTQVEPPPVRTYRGTVLEDPTIRVRASYRDGQLRATFIGENDGWSLQPTSDVDPNAPRSRHVMYRAGDLLPSPYVCGGTVNDEIPAPGGAFGAATTGIRICEVGIDADFAFYQANGSDVADTVDDIETVMNSVESIYEDDDILIGYEITTIVIRTAPGTYTTASPSGLLNQFDDVWSSAPESTIDRDIAHLFTGINLSGSVIGIARLSTICSFGNGYGLSQSRYTSNFTRRVSLTAHELGHNWSATHCNSSFPCRIMCSSNGGCDGLSPLAFGPSATNQISNFRDTRTCLSILPNSIALPFEDNFPSPAIDGLKWTYVNGAAVNSNGIGEPTSPYALNLDAAGSGLYSDDEIRSGFMLLTGSFEPQLQYFTQHRGVPAGGQLFVEYWNSAREWVAINTLTSDGVDESVFTQHLHDLPFDARHNEFRLRFRVDVDSNSHDWYIDNVSVTEGDPPPPPAPVILQITPPTGSLAGGTEMNVFGQNFTPDAVVTVGSGALQNQVYVDSNLIVGMTPPSATPGPKTVSITQSSGDDDLVSSFIYTDNSITVESATLSPGGTTLIRALASHDADLAGYSLGCSFDGTWFDVESVDVLGTDAEAAEFVAPNLSNAPGDSWWTIGVVVDLSPPLSEVLTAGANTIVAAVVVTASPSAPSGVATSFLPESGVGDPPVDLVFSIAGGTSATPSATAGTVSIVDVDFIRGDGNQDGTVDVADAVASLAYQFDQGPGPCLDAHDVNDDGVLNIADPVQLLAFIFSGGPPPLAPYPNPGVDPTPDSLGCE